MGYFLGKNLGGTSNAGTLSLRDAIARVTGEADAPLGSSLTSGSFLDRILEKRASAGGAGGLKKPVTRRTQEQEPVPDELGEWAWPDEMRDLYNMLWGKAEGLMTKEPGFGEDEIEAMFGRDFSKIRGAESGKRRSVLDTLAAQGMLDTGTEIEAMKDLANETEANVGGVRENIFLANEAQKRQDIQSFAQLAESLFNTLGGFSTTEEAMNAARRNEANNMLGMLLQYYLASQGQGGG